MIELQQAIDSHIAFKKAYDECINAQNIDDLSIFGKYNDELNSFGNWLQSKEADYGDLSQLKMLHKHFHYFAFKYTDYLKKGMHNEAEMIQLALDNSSNKILVALTKIKDELENDNDVIES